jgi:hypothetical protein
VLGVSFGGLVGLILLALRISALYHNSGLGLDSRATIEQFYEAMLNDTNELSGVLETVQDVPSARKAESRIVELLDRMSARFRDAQGRKAQTGDIDAVTARYRDRFPEAARRMGSEVKRIVAIPGVIGASPRMVSALAEFRRVAQKAGDQDKSGSSYAFQPMPPAPPNFGTPPPAPPNFGHPPQAGPESSGGQFQPNRPGFGNGPQRPMPPRRIRPRFGPRAEPPGF